MDESIIENIAKRIWQHCEDYKWGNGKSMLCRLDFERIIREELTLTNKQIPSEVLEGEFCKCGHDFETHKKPESGISWDVCSFPCALCCCTEYEEQPLKSAAAVDFNSSAG